MKNIIKMVTKISLLARNEQFTPDELKLASEFQSKFRKTAMTVISFYEVDFSYDQKFLLQVCQLINSAISFISYSSCPSLLVAG